jgi:transcriptional regulator with XRE-family HTH domain
MTDQPTSTTPAPDSFAVKLKAAREAAGLPKTQATKLAGVSGPTYANWEFGRSTPSPQKQGAVLRKLREALIAEANAQPDPQPTETAATPEELAHDPYPDSPEGHDDLMLRQEAADAMRNTPLVTVTTPAAIPETPVGNVHTSQDGVVRRRLADDDDRDGAEVIDGRRWFTVGFAPPHPRAKATVRAIAVEPVAAPPAPVPATPEAPKRPPHTETTPKAQKPVESAAVATAGQRDWAWWLS